MIGVDRLVCCRVGATVAAVADSLAEAFESAKSRGSSNEEEPAVIFKLDSFRDDDDDEPSESLLLFRGEI